MAGGRRRADRDDQLSRARQEPQHRAAAARADPQPAPPRLLGGRLVGRQRRRGRGGHRARRPRQRRWRLDPHPGVDVRADRPQAVARPGVGVARQEPARLPAGHQPRAQPLRSRHGAAARRARRADAGRSLRRRPPAPAVRRGGGRRPGAPAHRTEHGHAVGRCGRRRLRARHRRSRGRAGRAGPRDRRGDTPVSRRRGVAGDVGADARAAADQGPRAPRRARPRPRRRRPRADDPDDVRGGARGRRAKRCSPRSRRSRKRPAAPAQFMADHDLLADPDDRPHRAAARAARHHRPRRDGHARCPRTRR